MKSTTKQQTDKKGRVIPTRELIQADIERLCLDYQEDKRLHPAFIKAMTEYVMEQCYKDYAANVKLGLDIGRREAGAAFLSAFEAEVVPDFEKFMAEPDLTGYVKKGFKMLHEAYLEAAQRAVTAVTTAVSPDLSHEKLVKNAREEQK